MKADNNIVSNESLEDAAKLFLKSKDDEIGTIWTEDDEDIIKAFCDFHKEQLKPLLESHADLLKWVNKLKIIAETEIPKFNSPDLNNAIKKANKLLNSIK